MPKVYLTAQQKRNEVFVRNVGVGMARLGIKNKTELAKKLPFSRQTLYNKLDSPDKFTYGELMALCSILKLTNEEKLEFMT